MATVQLTDELERLAVAHLDDIPKTAADIGAATVAQGEKADSAVQPAQLSPIAELANSAVQPSELEPIALLASNAVPKVEGMGLSEKSYSASEQAKLGSMSAFGVIYGRDIGGFGDSFTANCHSIAATAYATENYGYLGNVAAMSGTAFASYLNNFGVVGQNTGEFAARISGPLASACKIWIMPSVTNDFTTANMTLDDTKRNVMWILDQFTAAGKMLIVGTGTPRYGDKLLAVPEARRPDILAYRDWVMSYVSQFTLIANTYDDFPQSGTVDNLHPAPENAVRLAKAYLPAILSLKLRPIPLPISALDAYSVRSPSGSLLPNPALSATLGTGTANASANATANPMVADGYTVIGSGISGVTTTLTVEPSALPGMNAQVIKLGGSMGSAGGYVSFQPLANVTLSNLVAGDVISFLSAYDLSGTQRGLLSVELELIVVKPVGGTSTTIYYRAMDKYQTGFPMNANLSGALESQRYVVDKTETSIRVRAACYLETSVVQDQRIAISQPALRRG